MSATLSSLLTLQVYTYLLVFCRVGAVFFLMPGFGETFVPARVRLGAGLAASLVLTPLQAGVIAAVPPPAHLAAQVGSELLIGLTIGVWLRLFVYALFIAGAVIAQQLALNHIFNGVAENIGTSALSNLLMLTGINLFFALNLHGSTLAALADNLRDMPLGQGVVPVELFTNRILEAVGSTFATGISLAVPFLVVGTLLYAALGFVNRAMPQMMVFFVAAPAITATGLVLFLIALPMILTQWAGGFEALLANF
ncbi:MAG: flagellar biosynthetic protein FliR [Alphaproteobacteria bacterium]|nr:flagellar biosynthetic protein FliR [Alphaproteobacteria bacterium]MCB9928145.1 flagellar biosynthetic protein FliR [Alphaproteobacteria bacterium]